jgi:hypothetical protein
MTGGRLAAVLGLSLLALCPSSAPAQENEAGNPDPDPDRVVNPVPFAEPSHEMRKADFLLGTWTLAETWSEPRRYKRGNYRGHPGDGGYGTATCRLGPGDFSLECDYQEHNPMGRVTSRTILSWDPSDRLYRLDRIHSAFPGILRLSGGFEGGDLVFRGEDSSTGRRLPVRLVFTGWASDRLTETLEVVDGKRASPVVTIRFARTPPAP